MYIGDYIGVYIGVPREFCLDGASEYGPILSGGEVTARLGLGI